VPGQLVLAVLAGIFLAAFMRMRGLSNSEPEARFLSVSNQFTKSDYVGAGPLRPRLVRTGEPS
jgi:hypothetical protein